jgi:tRNA (guanine37-N1)-methyltransferase
MAKRRYDVLTLFPEMFRGPVDESILKRAAQAGLLEIHLHDLRDFTADRHHTADDSPFGGGAGMVLMVGPIFDAVAHVREAARAAGWSAPPEIILTAAQGRRFNQSVAEELAHREHLVFICGHYEGVDDRVREHLATDQLSIGDYVLTGGELATMVMIDAIARLVPGVLGAAESLREESISGGLLEYPQYTRPADFRGWQVPEVLLSGNHAAIAHWRRAQSLRLTYGSRPDLLIHAPLARADAEVLAAQVPLPGAKGEAPDLESRRLPSDRDAADNSTEGPAG